MQIKNLKKGMVLFNPDKKQYVQIKEITYYNDKERTPVDFVCSGYCNYFGDTTTTVNRQVLTSNDIYKLFYLDPIGDE